MAATEKQIKKTALAIRNARPAEDSMGTVQKATNLAVDQSNTQGIDLLRADIIELQKGQGIDLLRAEIIELQKRSLEVQEKLVSAVASMVETLRDADPLVVSVPETKLTISQAPVNVTIPKAAPIEVKPVINVPETKVVIDKRDHEVLKRATIKHSDGTKSEIEFK